MMRARLSLLAPIALFLVIAMAGSADPAASQSAAAPPSAESFRADALSIEPLVNGAYAYPERFEKGQMPMSDTLRAEAARVQDRQSLLRYAERALLVLADHHAITGSSLADSWAVVPSYADLWIERDGPDYAIEAVRRGSPAEAAGIKEGDRLVAIGGVPIQKAVEGFWEDLGLAPDGVRAAFAARVLAAGRRNAPRSLTIKRGDTVLPALDLPNLYAVPHPDRPPVSVSGEGAALRIRMNDSLGDGATIAAFDLAMAQARPRQRVIIDLTDTPSGGNTSVARAMLGWFVARAHFYQMHNLPAEARETGIERQWVEQVLPRPGKRHKGAVTVEVGRWTGSMGEGLAIGFDAIGADVVGTRMAGLLGAVYDLPLEHSGLVIKLPAERVMAVDGTPRELFRPRPRRR